MRAKRRSFAEACDALEEACLTLGLAALPETLDKLARVVSVIWPNQTWTTMRASELVKWVHSGEYEAVLQRGAAVGDSSVAVSTRRT